MSLANVEAFIKHGVYLRNWSSRTVRTYRQGLNALEGVIADEHGLTKPNLAAFVIAMRERGQSPGGINMYARTINSYLSWLHAEGMFPNDCGSSSSRIRRSRMRR